MLIDTFVVDSPNVRYDDEHITATYKCAPSARARADARRAAAEKDKRATRGAYDTRLVCGSGRARRCRALPRRAWRLRARALARRASSTTSLCADAARHVCAARSYASTSVEKRAVAGGGGASGGGEEWVVTPVNTRYEFRTKRNVPKLGCAARCARARAGGCGGLRGARKRARRRPRLCAFSRFRGVR
jgi:hypothetical protein